MLCSWRCSWCFVVAGIFGSDVAIGIFGRGVVAGAVGRGVVEGGVLCCTQ